MQFDKGTYCQSDESPSKTTMSREIGSDVEVRLLATLVHRRTIALELVDYPSAAVKHRLTVVVWQSPVHESSRKARVTCMSGLTS
jgi:hypothetical protein